MNNNYTYKVVIKEFQKKIVNYLYQNNHLTTSEYELLILRLDDKIIKLKKLIELDKDNYIYPIKVDIGILK